jgi:hypothetical protein
MQSFVSKIPDFLIFFKKKGVSLSWSPGKKKKKKKNRKATNDLLDSKGGAERGPSAARDP